MPDALFTKVELEAYPPPVTVAQATADLVLALVTAEIRGVVGADRYDALTDVSALKPVALALARRMVDNPGGKRSTSRQLDDYSETDTYATESLAPAELTDSEIDRIHRAVGLDPAGAFTIRPAGTGSLRRYRSVPVWRRC
ncbi:hypothetical protein ACIBJE_02085 [Micromonospora sp. NPDC050187]|uniref:hypothetical protein n=1 Tax=Micromonospora sp. NPDC050187 TaxID=3364277 RepID=UPI00378BFD75